MSLPPPLPEHLDLASPRPLSVRTAVVHAVALGMMASLFLKIVPAFTKIFKDFDATLPVMTIAVIEASMWAKNYWYVAVLLTPFYFAGLYQVGKIDKPLQRSWTTLIIVFVALLLMFAVVALFLPLVTLIQKLS